MNTRLRYTVPSLIDSPVTSFSPGNARGRPLLSMHGASTCDEMMADTSLVASVPGSLPLCTMTYAQFSRMTFCACVVGEPVNEATS